MCCLYVIYIKYCQMVNMETVSLIIIVLKYEISYIFDHNILDLSLLTGVGSMELQVNTVVEGFIVIIGFVLFCRIFFAGS